MLPVRGACSRLTSRSANVVSEVFRPRRFEIARLRRKMSLSEIEKRSGVSTKELRRVLDGMVQPREATISAVADALRYPRSFFLQGDEDVPVAATFRARRAMTEREKGAGLAAGALGQIVSDWAVRRYDGLPEPEVPDLSDLRPQDAAAALREIWGLGSRPIGNIVRLLESKGVRVFSLSEDTLRMNAFALWVGRVPFVFLNNKKSAEASRFDAAHELGHLCLHREGQEGFDRDGLEMKEVEAEANAFASAFLMPRGDVLASKVYPTLGKLIELKARWGVSVAALVYRYRELGLINEERSKFLYIEMSRQGFLKDEPNPRQRDQSSIWAQVLQDLWREKKTIASLAEELALPVDELEALILFGGRPVAQLAGDTAVAPRLSLAVSR